MAGTDFTLQILRTVVTLVTVLCYTVVACFVVARSNGPLTAALPLPLLAVLYVNFGLHQPAPPPRSPDPARDTDGKPEGVSAEGVQAAVRSGGALQAAERRTGGSPAGVRSDGGLRANQRSPGEVQVDKRSAGELQADVRADVTRPEAVVAPHHIPG